MLFRSKKFHPGHTPKEEVDKAAQAAGFKTWAELFAARNAPPENPERPTMAAWVPTSRVSDPVLTLKRNPYYVGVDPDGNQLPYIDEVRFTYFADVQALNLAAIAGQFDMQERHIQMTNYPVFKDEERKGKYRILTWSTFGGADATVTFNQTYAADPEMGKLMANRNFRIALSHAINRDQIRESAFLGLGEARQPVPRRHREPPGQPHQRRPAQAAGRALLRDGHDHVELSTLEAGQHLPGREIVQLHLGPGMHPGEAGDRRRHQALGQRGRVADPQPAARAGRLHALHGLIGEPQKFARLVQHHLAGRREAHRVCVSLKQALPDLLLQRLDLPAQRRLREEDLSGGPADVAGIRDGDEVAQLPEFHE